jgi:hypothetical protein
LAGYGVGTVSDFYTIPATSNGIPIFDVRGLPGVAEHMQFLAVEYPGLAEKLIEDMKRTIRENAEKNTLCERVVQWSDTL